MNSIRKEWLVITPIWDEASLIATLHMFRVEADSLADADGKAEEIVESEQFWGTFFDDDDPSLIDGYVVGEWWVLPLPVGDPSDLTQLSAELLDVPSEDAVVDENARRAAARRVELLAAESLDLLRRRRHVDAQTKIIEAGRLVHESSLVLTVADFTLVKASRIVASTIDAAWAAASLTNLAITSRHDYWLIYAHDGSHWLTDQPVAMPPSSDGEQRLARAAFLDIGGAALEHAYTELLRSVRHVGADAMSLTGNEAQAMVQMAVTEGLLERQDAERWWPNRHFLSGAP
jgi:hypothetical protein